jgi:hypothetical protein
MYSAARRVVYQFVLIEILARTHRRAVLNCPFHRTPPATAVDGGRAAAAAGSSPAGRKLLPPSRPTSAGRKNDTARLAAGPAAPAPFLIPKK